jgi:leader peptidase (prepilin peptidase)/N-methyltransferase
MVYHVTALSVAWACGLIRLDGKRLPGKLVAFALAVTVLPMLVYPSLMVVPWQMTVSSLWQPQALYLDAVVRVATALAAATILARYLAKAFCPAADPKLDPLGQSTARLIDLIVMLSVPALVVGWQAVIAVVVIASLLGAALHHRMRPRREAFGCFGIALPLALTVQLVFWRQLHAPDRSSLETVGTWYWPSDGGLPWVLLGWAGIVLLIPFWLRDGRPTSLAKPTPSADPNLGVSEETSARLPRQKPPDPSAE